MTEEKEKNKFNWYFVLNILVVVVITAIAAYNPASTSGKGILGFTQWTAPLVFMTLVLLFEPRKFFTPRHTAVNVGMLLLAGFILLAPPPEQTASMLKWFYPITVALLIDLFISLD